MARKRYTTEQIIYKLREAVLLPLSLAITQVLQPAPAKSPPDAP